MSKFEELLSKLLDTVPELSRSVIEDKIKEKKDKIGAGYLTDDGALFLIAADLGITLEQSKKMEIELKDLFVGAKEVTVESRILNMSPTKQFTKKETMLKSNIKISQKTKFKPLEKASQRVETSTAKPLNNKPIRPPRERASRQTEKTNNLKYEGGK